VSFGKRAMLQQARPMREPIKNKKKNSWTLISVVIAVVAGVVGRAAGHEFYNLIFHRTAIESPDQIDAMLAEVVKRTKPTLPKRLDDITTMTDIAYADRHMMYVYDLDEAATKEGADLMPKLRNAVAGRVCGSEMKQAMGYGYIFSFRYNRPDGREIGEFSLGAADCG
jgi:hypothetical protein